MASVMSHFYLFQFSVSSIVIIEESDTKCFIQKNIHIGFYRGCIFLEFTTDLTFKIYFFKETKAQFNFLKIKQRKNKTNP